MGLKHERIQPEKLYVRGGSKPLYSHVTAIEGGRKLIFNSRRLGEFALAYHSCRRHCRPHPGRPDPIERRCPTW